MPCFSLVKVYKFHCKDQYLLWRTLGRWINEELRGGGFVGPLEGRRKPKVWAYRQEAWKAAVGWVGVRDRYDGK